MNRSTLDAEQTKQLVQRCLKGDQSGFAALYDLFAPGLYRLCYSLLLNREDAEDVTQESFVYAFKNLYRFDANLSSLKTWLYTIAICRCRNLYRKHKVPMVDLTVLLNIGLPAPRSETPEAALARQHAKDGLEKALVELNPRLREAIVLRYGHGLSYREIAEVMGCPQKTAESRVRLGHETLRGTLGVHGHGLLDELLVWNEE
ncbi:MAG: ECF subfamily RNA polymerase sigma-24 factor [Chloroflexi bacterium OLB15]|nr:MAG: ECF subfamily RNA polymerase sigma-24 factor [Chloroflexi bacterium OLB15]